MNFINLSTMIYGMFPKALLSYLDYFHEGFSKNGFTPSMPPERDILRVGRTVVNAQLKKRCLRTRHDLLRT